MYEKYDEITRLIIAAFTNIFHCIPDFCWGFDILHFAAFQISIVGCIPDSCWLHSRLFDGALGIIIAAFQVFGNAFDSIFCWIFDYLLLPHPLFFIAEFYFIYCCNPDYLLQHWPFYTTSVQIFGAAFDIIICCIYYLLQYPLLLTMNSPIIWRWISD